MTNARGGIVLVLGSAPDAMAARSWDATPFSAIVAINNAWRVRDDWTHHIHPEDFPADRRPPAPGRGQNLVGWVQYVPCQNLYGGVVYAGGTMAFTAGYWALGYLQPRILAYAGCDMVYPETGRTHFYGRGSADPLRQDPTLRSLEAKSARLYLMAARQGCRCVNLSDGPSRLVFPRAGIEGLAELAAEAVSIDPSIVAEPEQRESHLGYYVESGRYWEDIGRFDVARIDALDRLWIGAFEAAVGRPGSGLP